VPTTFTQHHLDPDHDPKPQPRFPLSAIIWLPLALLFGAGIVYSARYGYEKATTELGAMADPAAGNETFSKPFVIDPGDDPMLLAEDKEALRDQQSHPPGSEGSGTAIVSDPIQLRIIERDFDLARVIVIGGDLDGRRLWARAYRLDESKRRTE